MPARKGQPKVGGRVKGTPNKVNSAVADMLREMGCNPFVGMAKIAEKAMESGDYDLAGKMFNNLSPYIEPKLSSSTLDAHITGNIHDERIKQCQDLKKTLQKHLK